MADIDLREFVSLIEFPKYLINRNGRIYSLYRNMYLKESECSKGYYRYSLTNYKGDLIRQEGQRFVAQAWLPNPENKPTVDHINRNPKDNRVENLRWATWSENQSNRINSLMQRKRKIWYEICDGYSKRYEKASLAQGSTSQIWQVCNGHRATVKHRIYSYNPPCLDRPYKIAFSSGACAGKTTMLPALKEKLGKYHYNVIIVPEAATQLLNEGLLPDANFQFEIAKRQLLNEENAERLAQKMTNDNYNETIILYDRSFICNQAYCSETVFNRMVEELNLGDIYERYDACIHLETGAKFEYHPEGRFETQEEAIELDKKTLQFTIKHRNFVFIKAQPREWINRKELSLYSNTMRLINKIRSFER